MLLAVFPGHTPSYRRMGFRVGPGSRDKEVSLVKGVRVVVLTPAFSNPECASSRRRRAGDLPAVRVPNHEEERLVPVLPSATDPEPSKVEPATGILPDCKLTHGYPHSFGRSLAVISSIGLLETTPSLPLSRLFGKCVHRSWTASSIVVHDN